MLLQIEASELGQQNLEPVRLVTYDLDGVIAKAPIPGKTVLKLVTHTYSPPKLGKEYKPYKPNHSVIDVVVARLITPHERRALIPGVVEGLREFRAVAERQQVEIVQGVLSGRDMSLHDLTYKWLRDNGLLGEFFDEISLNTGKSSSLWKEIRTNRGVKRFRSVAHIDDDLKAAQRVGQINGQLFILEHGSIKEAKVLSFLIRNGSNNPWLLRWAGVELAENVVPVQNIYEAARYYEKKLLNGEI